MFLVPTAYPLLGSGKKTEEKPFVVPLDKAVQLSPPLIVFKMGPPPATYPTLESVKKTEEKPSVVPNNKVS
ncbi:MAG: hypothetical protein D4R97_02660 [Bacteroidetes bacterium]|nr:MAG: hypothetical protein D4R97_02660 [Bacteroidota bacterium]